MATSAFGKSNKMRYLILLINFFLLISGQIYSQCSLSSAIKALQGKGNFDTLYYYGLDFSHVKINDPVKIPRSENYSKAYPPAWIYYIETEITNRDIRIINNKLQGTVDLKDFNYCQADIFDRSVKVDPQFIIGTDNTLPLDTLKAMIKNYKLSTKAGLGLVLVPETFSKPLERAFTWIIFFDIHTRNILVECKTSGKCSHMGYTKHWASGIIKGYDHFANH